MTHNTERPLSPHLQVYKPQMTTVMSILHRMTGAGLAVGLILLVWVLVAAATSVDAFNQVISLCRTTPGMVLLFCWTFALYYHMANGVRHLFWDMGYLFKIKNAYRAGYVVLLFSIGMTILTWCCAS